MLLYNSTSITLEDVVSLHNNKIFFVYILVTLQIGTTPKILQSKRPSSDPKEVSDSSFNRAVGIYGLSCYTATNGCKSHHGVFFAKNAY